MAVAIKRAQLMQNCHGFAIGVEKFSSLHNNKVAAANRPAVVGLLAAATLLLCNTENFSSPVENPWQFWISVALFIATAFGTGYLKINPIRMICYAAFAGLLLLY